MKVLKKKYPMGSFPYQKSPGRYVDALLYSNLKFMASKIVKDMTFLGFCFSSTLEVGTGKSVLMTQVGEIWTAMINKMHGLNLKFTEKNIVWKPKDLIQRSFELPKYSCILLDEWEDAHYWSEMGKTLREYFRKCRQQNLFILAIIPNYFQLPPSYAMNRSIFSIDVKFDEELERGNYDFYDFGAKKDLYIKGKKFYNYKVSKPTFKGHFGDGYGINKEKYLKAKREDLEEWDKKEKKVERTPEQIAYETKLLTLRKVFDNKNMLVENKIKTDSLAKTFKVPFKTMEKWLQEGKKRQEKIFEITALAENHPDYINKHNKEKQPSENISSSKVDKLEPPLLINR